MSQTTTRMPASGAARGFTDTVERLIREAVDSVRFGTVEITIHDARVVQIDRTEKVRVP